MSARVQVYVQEHLKKVKTDRWAKLDKEDYEQFGQRRSIVRHKIQGFGSKLIDVQGRRRFKSKHA